MTLKMVLMAMSIMTDDRDCDDDSNNYGEYSGSHVHFMDDLDQGLWNSEAGPDYSWPGDGNGGLSQGNDDTKGMQGYNSRHYCFPSRYSPSQLLCKPTLVANSRATSTAASTHSAQDVMPGSIWRFVTKASPRRPLGPPKGKSPQT